MVVPFDKQQQIHGRYQLLSPQPVLKQLEHDGDDMSQYDGQEYATFMKSLNMGSLKPQDKLSRPKAVMKGIKRSKTPTQSENFVSSISIGAKSAPASIHHNLQYIHEIKKKNDQNHQKNIKTIEDYMFTCKQRERELKRVEGDILKNEKNVKKAMKSIETEIYNDQRQQEKLLRVADKEQLTVKQNYHTEDEKITKRKINRNINTLQKEKEVDRKAVSTLNGLEFRFENLADAIEMKRKEVDTLVQDFEKKVRQKEEEEFQLKKEFANLSLKMNMVAQKQRVQQHADDRNAQTTNLKDKEEQLKRENILQEKLRFQKDRVNNAESSKRQLSKELQVTTNKLMIQNREEGRRLTDVKSKLYDNSLNQKGAQIKAELLEMERQGILSDEKIMTVNARRKVIQDMITQQRKQKNDLSMDEWRRRNFAVNHEMKKEDLKDNISHFQKIVSKQDDAELVLYNQVRNLESEHRKQEQTVLRLKEELNSTQIQNKILLKETSLRCHQQELQLQQKLQKEEAQLSKALSEREERVSLLVKSRGASKEDRHYLDEQLKIQDRLNRIQKKSQLLQNQQQIQEIY